MTTHVGEHVLGLDACRAGWVGVLLPASAPDAEAGIRVGTTVADLLAWASGKAPLGLVAVDIPIGLPDRARRQADVLARAELGPRRSSVFMTPTRAALDEGTHAAASAVNRERAGEGISTQAFNLRTKLQEVEAIAHGGAYRFVEVHPELSFTRMAGHPLPSSKKTADGQRLRRNLLEQAGIRVDHPVRVGAGVDDVLDAAAAAWSGRRVLTGVGRPLPDPPEVFSDGWPAAIWA